MFSLQQVLSANELCVCFMYMCSNFALVENDMPWNVGPQIGSGRFPYPRELVRELETVKCAATLF